jgi:hypothetical protein
MNVQGANPILAEPTLGGGLGACRCASARRACRHRRTPRRRTDDARCGDRGGIDAARRRFRRRHTGHRQGGVASFRKLALGLPNVVEHAHMGHPDFRIGGKIFAGLDYPRAGWAMVALTPDDQNILVKMHPKAFVPVKGKWGEQGATNIELRHATAAMVRAALDAAHETRQARSGKTRS